MSRFRITVRCSTGGCAHRCDGICECPKSECRKKDCILQRTVPFSICTAYIPITGGKIGDERSLFSGRSSIPSYLNIVLAMFNLIPIPPLDGSHLFKYLLPQELRPNYEKLGRTGAGFIILILVINIPGLWNIFSTVLLGLRDFLLGNLIFF